MTSPSAQEIEAAATLLAATPFFASLDPGDRRAVVEAGEVVDVPAGGTIVAEGAVTSDFFVLLSGEGSVQLGLDDPERPTEVGTVRPGETVGEIGALLEEPRTATVIAARPCRLLRIDAARLEALYAASPRVGVAVSRELARRLRAEQAEKNTLQRLQLPETVSLAPPDVTRLREYMSAYYASALRHVVTRHQLLVDRRFPSYEAQFTISHAEQARWLQLFGAGEARAPFTYFTTVGTLVLMQVVGDVGINFRHLLHLRTEADFVPGRRYETDVSYRLASRLEDIIALRHDRVALMVVSRIHDPSGFRFATYRDFFVILNLEPGYVSALSEAKAFGRTDVSDLQGFTSRRATLHSAAGVRRASIDIPEDMGMRYGKVSGDLNLVHTTRIAAKLFGYKRPFIQGLCTVNCVLSQLTRHGIDPASYRMTFPRQVYCGQRIDVLHDDHDVEVCDSKGSLLAYGSFTQA